jgi:hypothetical protein
MKTRLLSFFLFFSLILSAQNEGAVVEINILNAPSEEVDVTICFDPNTSPNSICYVVPFSSEMANIWSIGAVSWENATASIVDCDGSTLSTSFSHVDTVGYVYYLEFFYCESDSIWGCTDPDALNYNPFANIDDGSCLYTGPDNDLCADAAPLDTGLTLIDNTFATNNEGIFGECWNFGSGEGEQSSLWFTFTTPSEPAQIHIEAIGDGSNTLNDTQFGLFEECGGEMIYCDGNSGQGLLSAFDFSCGELDTNATYILMVDGWNGDAGTCYLSYEVTEPCNFEVFGCTDPLANNYNPDATVDDGSCTYSCSEVLLGFDFFGAAPTDSVTMSWTIFDSAGEAIEEELFYSWSPFYALCLEDGCYTLTVNNIDPEWEGLYSLSVINQQFYSGEFDGSSESFTVEFGVNTPNCGNLIVEGCTDPDATNFNPQATVDDGSCEYYECDANTLLFNLTTQNWGYEISWNIVDETGTEVWGNGDYESYSTTSELVCLEDGCYTLEMFDSYGDGWNGAEFTITLNDSILASGTLTLGQADYGEIPFGVNSTDCVVEDILGCTDPEALNYNPEATADDGTCEYEFECGISFEVYADSLDGTFFIMPSENIFSADSVWWDFGDGNTSTDLFPTHFYDGDGPYTLCLFVTFSDEEGNFCQISYCEVLDAGAFGENGFLSEGFTVNVIAPGTLNTEESSAQPEIAVFPNPTTDFVSVRFRSKAFGQTILRLIDLQGKVLEDRIIGTTNTQEVIQLDLSNYPQGLYLIGLERNESMNYAKVVRR